MEAWDTFKRNFDQVIETIHVHQFHKSDKKEPTFDKTRLQFVLIPEPPEDLTESQLTEWFPSGRIDVLVFDCLYKILLGTFTNPQRCSLVRRLGHLYMLNHEIVSCQHTDVQVMVIVKVKALPK